MNRITVFLACSLLLSGCVAKAQKQSLPPEATLQPVVVYQSLGASYLLSCLKDAQNIGRGAFDFNFDMAEKDLQSGKDLDKLRFICLSLNEKADQKQFKAGLEVLAQYIDGHSDSDEEMQGVQVLAERLNQEILNRWNAWKTLLNDKKVLTAEVESLRQSLATAEARNGELQAQIEQLKQIDEIMKNREKNQR